jgi:hypothetical protein
VSDRGDIERGKTALDKSSNNPILSQVHDL